MMMSSVITPGLWTAGSPAAKLGAMKLNEMDLDETAKPIWLGSARRRLRAAGLMALDALLPPRCLACGGAVDAQGALCAACWQGISFLGAPCCARCGLPFPYDAGAGAECGDCIAYPPPFDRARAVFAYDDHSRRLILGFKHADKLHGMPAFGQWLARSGAELLGEADLIAPVPLHWTRLFRRRFNQSALLARAAVAAWAERSPTGLVFAPQLLVRRRRTRSQGHLSRLQRAENVRGAFALKPGADVAGKRVLLVDDVFTTGATIEACARVLKRAGAVRVDVLTLARAMRLSGGAAP
jgi:ComF family protein